MLLAALHLFGLVRHSRQSWFDLGGDFFASPIRSVMVSGAPAAPLTLRSFQRFFTLPAGTGRAIAAGNCGGFNGWIKLCGNCQFIAETTR